MLVQKRNGKYVEFDKQRIIDAINKAFVEVDGDLYENETSRDAAEEIEQFYKDHPNVEPTVENIQDYVEKYLMHSERPDVARAYIRFRYKKEASRKFSSEFLDEIKKKLMAEDVQNQNANVDEHSFGGRIGEASSTMMKKLALDYFVSDMARENHLGNMIYIHDLDHYCIGDHNCLTIPFDKLLANGFNTRQTDVRPAQSVNTAFQLIAVIFQLQSLQQFGGVSASHIDWTMIPYVRKSFAKHYKDGLLFIRHRSYEEIDYEIEGMLINSHDYSIEDPEWKAYDWEVYDYALAMTKKEVDQGAEGLYHNLNTLQSRSGNQLN